jgi:hypothetical protein
MMFRDAYHRSLRVRLVVLIAAGATVLSTACLAPMCRTSEIERGLTLSVDAGPTLFRSGGTVRDTSSWWGGRSVALNYFGAQADVRATYGLTPWLGADFTAGVNSGTLINRPESLDFNMPGFCRVGLAALFRPWQHNSLMFVEYQMPHLFSLGWVSGLPLHGREQWSVMAQAGVIPFYIAQHGNDVGWRDFVPEFTQVALRRNFSLGRSILAPSFGGNVTWNWNTFRPTLLNVMLGVNWSLPSLLRNAETR